MVPLSPDPESPSSAVFHSAARLSPEGVAFTFDGVFGHTRDRLFLILAQGP